MNILVVENDFLQYDWIRESLKRSFLSPDNVEIIRTEREFYSKFDEIAEDPPAVIIMDVMLQWTTPSENLEMEKPPDPVLKGGHQSAGLRCERKLAADPRTKDIPVILYTVLERADLEENLSSLPSHVKHLRKESDPYNLFQIISDVIKRPQHKPYS